MKRKPIPVDADRPEPVTVEELRAATGNGAMQRILLRISQERLARALELERECNLPLAETSVIQHDVQKLSKALDQDTTVPSPSAPAAPQPSTLAIFLTARR